MLTTLAIANYRSIRELILPLQRLNVVTGANGVGKSNLYKALRLLADTARGSAIPTLAREGGLSSALWAGPEVLSRRMKLGEVPVEGTRRKDSVNLRLGFCDDELGYSIDFGLPKPSGSAFSLDPEIRRECVFAAPSYRPNRVLVDRRNALVKIRGEGHGAWDVLTSSLPAFDGLLSTPFDPRQAPELLTLRERVRSWRFYDHFRVDAEAPARHAMVGTRTPVLAADGRDVAAALQTILEIGDAAGLHAAVADAFPGSKVSIGGSGGRMTLQFQQQGLLRPLDATELSDGTLRYLLWVAALLTPRPPALMVLNEPETSLHPDLLPSLARLIGAAAEHSQVWVVSHASRLVAALSELDDCNAIVLDKPHGETERQNVAIEDRPPWAWPER
jgi:predicted ATPase